MLTLVLRRLLMAIPLLLVVTSVMFVLTSFIPGDPARIILGESASPAAVEALRSQLGLDKPLAQQYFEWLAGVLGGDLGTSIYSGESVTNLLNGRLAATGSLILLSTIVVSVMGIALGMASAVKGGRLGRLLDSISLVGLALPSFWVAVVAVALLAVAIPLFPATGYVPFAQSPGGWLRSLVLPVFALSLVGTTIVAKQVRDSALDVMGKDYVRVLRANGIAERSILFRHVLRNASIPAVTMIGLGAIASLTGTVFVENVFVIPGLGQTAVSATLTKDLPLLLGLGLYFSIFVVLINLATDLAYGVLNPKVRAA
ncbi:ABC transporter permease [Pseudoclavibacter endophyticus]|uniref:ABC transporter permease n=1 Tax=Pseudoclavibacter endophyticus TaxID=1778590 RepID=A0A6H9WL42_9MICO|nr:ABC transporter permease [Pseudoclavibacter endophyticus]KAB1648758.1 ABC transporter permease [Pseudoclavibacter endophyticus]GGA68748.1 ABC transporter permease [Pseudoclavibacter endophyticus]